MMINKNLNKDTLKVFFDNVIGQIYISDPNKNNDTVTLENIEQVHLLEHYHEKSILLAKTNNVYFVAVCQTTENYIYSLITMHQDPVLLLSHFYKKLPFLLDVHPEEFWKKLQLKNSLNDSLTNKNSKVSHKI